jgi:hypothetical protein
MSIEDDIRLLEQVSTLALLGHEALRILAIGSERRARRRYLVPRGRERRCGLRDPAGLVSFVDGSPTRGASPPRPLRAPRRLAIRRGTRTPHVRLSLS